jgi:hypothetical protein
MRKLRESRSGLFTAIGAAAFAFVLASTAAEGQVVDPGTGRITSGDWLQLGPFTNTFGCSGINSDFLTLHLAPSSIHCLYPEEGDEVEYDVALASTTGYTGTLSPNRKPQWVQFDDGSDDSDLNMDATTLGDVSNVMIYIVTYIENTSGSDLAVDLCVNSDDGVQVWIDGALVHNNNACRGRGEATPTVCTDTVPATLTPGPHRIAIGIWEQGVAFGALFGINQGGSPILEGGPITYWGRENPGMSPPNPCLAFERTSTSPSDPDVCPPLAGGPLTVSIRANLPPGPDIAEVKETASGPFGAAQVSFPGGSPAGTVASIIPPGPITPYGAFQDGRALVLRPICPGDQNGAIVHDDAGTPADASDDSYEMTSVGEDIWATGDAFTYLYSKIQGDFVMTAHIAERSNPPSRWGKHGLMARQDLSDRSRYSYVHEQQDPDPVTEPNPADATTDQTRWASRPTHGGADNYETTGLLAGEHHDWVRLERAGSVFRGYSSPDGTDGSWVLHGSQDWGVAAPAAVLAGLAITSHSFDCNVPLTIKFDQVSRTGGALAAYTSPDPIGAEITWTNVPRATINAGNLKYVVDIPAGTVRMAGTAGTDPILGSGSGTLILPVNEHGPFTNPDFTHAHPIGLECAGTSITRPAAGTLVIAGAGGDIWQGGDQFMFAYTEVTGDFSARVTVTDRVFAAGSRWGKHGIMARQDCSTRARYSFIHDSNDGPAGELDPTRMANRPTHGGADNFEITPAAATPDHHANTLRLDRCGNEFIAYVLDEVGSFGGSPGDWVEIGRNAWVTDPPASVQVGLAVTSHQGCDTSTMTFEDWELLSTCDAPVTDLTCTETPSGGLDLAWTNPAGANQAVAISIEVDDAEFTTVPGTATSASLPASAFTPGQISRVDVINSSTVASTCNKPPSLNSQGFIKDWLILGPFTRPGGPAPGEDQIALDYLTDGVMTELNVMPQAGQSINTAYGAAAASTGLAATPGRLDINPGGVPTWFEHRDSNDTIDYNLDVFRTDINNVMCYAAAYVTVAEDTTVDIGLDSDDSVQVLIDGVQVHINNIARGVLAPNTVVDLVTAVNLSAGCHIILVKVFDGVQAHGFRLRLQDSAAQPVVPGTIGTSCGTPTGGNVRRGDSDSNGAVNITDAVRILNVLFLGIGAITCDDAADSDDNGAVNITDAVRILNVLFLGIGVIPPPTESCGPDPTDDALGCADAQTSCG